MASIVRVIAAPDGTDYDVVLSDGTKTTFHAGAPVADPQAWCDALEAEWLARQQAALQSAYVVITEAGDAV